MNGLYTLSLRLYRLLLHLYPAEHRRAYGPLMVQTFCDALVRTQVTLLDRIVNYPALYPAQSMVHGCGGHSGVDPIPALIDGGLESLSLFLGLVMMVVLYHPSRTSDPAVDLQSGASTLWDKVAPPATLGGESHAR